MRFVTARTEPEEQPVLVGVDTNTEGFNVYVDGGAKKGRCYVLQVTAEDVSVWAPSKKGEKAGAVGAWKRVMSRDDFERVIQAVFDR